MSSGNIKKFELKLGRTGLIIVVAGMAVLLCSSFILGVMVGKNIDTYPEKISSAPQQVLALFWRPAKVAGQQNVMEGKETHSDKGNNNLTFHNALTSRKSQSIKQPLAAERKPDDAATIESPKEEAVPEKEGTTEQKAPVSEKSPAETKSKIKEVPAAVHPAGSLFFIHVVSLKDKTRANQINKTVVELGYKSKVVKADIKGKGTWYRVIATGFETKPRAQAAVDRITRKVKTNCVIRPAGSDVDKNQ